jgi:anaerobic selenocysteine-containing dehydrogenase
LPLPELVGRNSAAVCPAVHRKKAADSALIVAWGINIKVSNIHFWQYVATARKKGARLVVIDPYKNQTARSADHYIRIKPGGDAGLALGICKILLESERLDRAFVAKATEGFEVLETYLRGCELSAFIRQSGVDSQQMRQLASWFADSAATFIRIGIGLTRNSRGAMSVRAITSLAASLGLFSGGPGRGVLLSSGAFSGDREVLVHKKLLAKETEMVNMIHLGHALTLRRPAVKALIVYNSNPLSVTPDSSSVRKGLARDDLFTVVHEQFMTPTAAYADLLLPASTFLENTDLYTSYGHFYLGVAGPVIEPPGEARSNFDFFQELALKMGFEDAPFYQSCKQRIRQYLSTIKELPPGTTVGQILSGGYFQSVKGMAQGQQDPQSCDDQEEKFRFFTPENPGEPAVSCITAAGESADPDLLSRFPLHLITPPHPDLLNSTFGEKFRDLPGEVLVSPEDAELYGVEDGSDVLLVNHRGSSRRIARVTTDTAQGVVVAEGIYWPVALAEGSPVSTGINDLTSQKISDMGGGATFHESLVRLETSYAATLPLKI